MSEEEKFDGVLLNMASQLEGGVPETGRSSSGKKYRSYSAEDLYKAYKLVKEKNYAVQRAADQYGIPESTLRDRVKGKIPMGIRRSGPAPVLGMPEERKLVEYLQLLTGFGYSYSRTDIINLATDYAVLLGKREPTDAFTHQWYYNFLSRWPNLEIKRGSGTKKQYERATSVDGLSQYFFNLQSLMTKYQLTNKPDSIFMVDEILIDLDRSPPSIYSWQANLKWEKYKKGVDPTMTLVTSGNAAGARLPAFFIFPGKTVSSESIEDCSPGTGATCSDDGTTNCNVFQLYLENHFLKFIERKDDLEPILLLYDGHRTHISPALVESYKGQNVHLFPIPPGLSQVIIHIGRSIFGEFESHFNDECDEFLVTEVDKSIHSNVCVVASKAYNQSVVAEVIKTFFQRAGIYPFKPQQVNKRIDLAVPMAHSSGQAIKKDKMIVVTGSAKSTRGALKRKAAKPRYSDSENEVDVESPESKRRGKKCPRKKANYSNRRKSSIALAKKKSKMETLTDEDEDSPSKKPALKLKFVRDTMSRSKSKTKQSSKGYQYESDQDTSQSDYESDTDSELDEMLSSEEEVENDDSKQYLDERRAMELATTQREHFESALREELLSTHGLYFEGTQRERFEKEFERAKMEYEKAEADKIRNSSVEPETIVENIEIVETATVGIEIKKDGTEEEHVIYSPEAGVSESTVETGPTVVIESVEVEIPSSETCCVCKQYHPDKMNEGYVVEFATWGKCEFENCEHWTHLKYCCDVKVLRRHDKFYCPCHNSV